MRSKFERFAIFSNGEWVHVYAPRDLEVTVGCASDLPSPEVTFEMTIEDGEMVLTKKGQA